ncbi:MAG: hypothetical protein ACRD0A_14015 [Acidimicrobiales bacterium]
MRSTTATTTDRTSTTVAELSEALANAFRTGEVGDRFTDDVFLDGCPPRWRFQLQGLDAFEAWLRDYTRHQPSVDVVHTTRTEHGFVTEQSSSEMTEDGEITGRKILLCQVRDDRIAAMTVYCNGAWDEELRARHAAEAPMIRP